MDFERVAQRLNGSLGRVWPLEGGVSARTTAIEVGRRTYVVREHADAALEFRLLQLQEMDDFTERYRNACPNLDFAALPERDLAAAERLTPQLPNWGLDLKAETRMRERGGAFAAENGRVRET